MLFFRKKQKFISLKEAATLTGYVSDYIGSLIRKGKLKGKKIYSGVSWMTTEEDIKKYQKNIETQKSKPSKKWKVFEFVSDYFQSVDIPIKIKETARKIAGIRKYKNKREKIFSFSWRFALLIIIFLSFIGIGPLEILQKIVGALTGEETTINLYSTLCTGDWQNSQNAMGRPEVGLEGDFNSFSESNSAIYKNGSLSLVCQDFKTAIEKSENNIQQPTEQELVEQQEIPEEGQSQEIPIQELQPTEPGESNENIEELPTSFFHKIKNFFGSKIIKAQQIPNSEELQNFPFQSAKIKFSFGIGEKRPDLEINQAPSTEEPGPPVEEPLAPTEEPEKTEEPSAPSKEQPVGIEITPESILPLELMNGSGSEVPLIETTEQPPGLLDRIKNLFGIKTAKAQGGDGALLENETPPIDTASPLINDDTSSTEVSNPLTEGIITPNLDSKIIIWYSLDTETWFQLTTISGQPLSNFLNGGYFSYEAPFLKSWDDVNNLKIKFEGVIGGETNIISYLDGIWLEINYNKQEEKTKETENLQKPKIKIKDNSLIIPQKEKNFSSDEEPTFIITGPKMKVEELINSGKGEVIEENQTPIDNETPREEEKSILEKVKEKLLSFINKRILPEKAGAQANPIRNSISNGAGKIKAKVFGPDGLDTGILPEVNSFLENGEELFEIKIPRTKKEFKPGLYKLEIEFEAKEAIYLLEQDFSWGVLAINVNKSIYLPDETVYIQMAVLRDDGHTICEANLTLGIISSLGDITFSEIQKSGECGPDNVTYEPDYFAYYQVGQPGIYKMKLTNLDNGYEISDSFEVKKSVPFDIERIGPTRIFPPAIYEMKFKIKANQDFEGIVKETVPSSFLIKNNQSEKEGILSFNILKFDLNSYSENSNIPAEFDLSKFNEYGFEIIQWEVQFQKDKTYEFSYQFDAPDTSPYIYLLGPLEISENPTQSISKIFSETRKWQIAADNPGCGNISGRTCASNADSTTCTACSGASCAWDAAGPCGGTNSFNCGGTSCDAYDECISQVCSTCCSWSIKTLTCGKRACSALTESGCPSCSGCSWDAADCYGTLNCTLLSDVNCTGCSQCEVSGITISGHAYDDEGADPIDGSGTNKTVNLRVNGAGSYTGEITTSDGAWAISSVTAVSGNIITIYLNDETEEATTVYVSDGTAQTNVDLYKNRVIVRADTGSITNANLLTGDDTDDDIKYSVSGSDLTVDDGFELHIWDGDTFAPGGLITTSPASSQSSTDGDIHIDGTAVLSAGGAISCGGDWTNEGTFTHNNNGATFTGTTTGFVITDGGENFYNVTFNGSGGGWSFADSTTIDIDLTTTAGILSGTNDIVVSGGDITGTNGSISLTGGTVTLSGTGNLGPTSSGTYAFSNLTLSGTTTAAGNFTVSSVLTISNTYSFDASSKTITLSGTTGTPFVITGTFTGSTSTFIYSGDNAGGSTTIAASANYNNLQINHGDETYVLGGTTTLSGDFTATAGTLSENADNLTVNGGDITGNGTITFTGGTVLLDGIGNFGGNTAWTFYDLTFGNGSGSTPSWTQNCNATCGTRSCVNLLGCTVLEDCTKAACSGSTACSDAPAYSTNTGGSCSCSGNDPICSCYLSIVKGSKVLMLDGSYKNIENVRVGDYVKSFDTETKQIANSRVEKISNQKEKDYLVINSTLKVTKDHNIYLNNNFQKAENAKLGDILLNEKGEGVKIFSIKFIPGEVITYHLSVDCKDNLFIGGYLVHNAGTCAGYTDCSASASPACSYGCQTGHSNCDGNNTNGCETESPTCDYSTTAGTGGITVSHVLTIASGATLDASSKTWTLSGTTGTPFVITGTFTGSTSTFIYSGDNAGGSTTITASANYNNLQINHGDETYVLGGTTTLSGDFTATAGTLSESSDNLTVNGGDITGDGTITFTGGTVLLDGAGNFCGDTAWTFYDLTFGNGADVTKTTKTGSGAITVSHVLTIAASQELDAGDDTWTLSGTTGTPFVNSGTFTHTTSTVQYTGANAGGNTNVVGSIDYYDLILNASDTFDAAGNIEISDVFTIQHASAIFDAKATTVTLSGIGTPFVITGTFTDSDSTVKYTGDGDTNITAATYNNLELSPTIIDNRVYTGAGAITVGGTLNINPTASSALSLTFTLGGTTSVTGLTTIQRTTSATSILDTKLDSNYTFNTGSLTIKAGGTLNGRASALDSNGDVTIEASGTLTSTSGNFNIGGSWSNSATGVFTHSSGTVIFDATTTGKTISDGGDPFYGLQFTGASGGWTYTDGCSTAPNTTVVNASSGTATFINAKTATSPTVTNGTLNVDWYLGVHAADAVTSTTHIDTGASDITISENSGTPQSTIWKYSGGWGDPLASQTTGTDSDGNNPQPTSTGAILIREYSKTSSATTYYLYNLKINWVTQGGTNYGEYDYYADYGSNYLTSTDNSGANKDAEIDVGWYRATIGTMNAVGTINEPPANGSWYCGMLAGLSVSINSYSVNLGAITPGAVPTDATNVLTITTSATNGYVVTAWSTQAMTCSDAGTCASETISDWTGTNASPGTWSSGSYGFGYSTNDTTLTGGTADRFSGPKFAAFSHSGSGDPVADRSSTECPCSNQQNTITYRIAAGPTQRAGPYQTTVIYIVTAQY